LDDESFFKIHCDYHASRLAQARKINSDVHPEIIREKAMNVSDDKWGYSNFGLAARPARGNIGTWLQKLFNLIRTDDTIEEK
jgi:hypothetical protein